MKLHSDKDSGQWPPRGRVSQHCPSLLVRLMVVASVWALAAVSILHSQQSKPAEYEVKAAYLYNFGRFVEWPGKVASDKSDSFRICVLGQDPFGRILDKALSGETIDGKHVVAKRITKPLEAVDCRILFISSSEEKRLNDTLMAIDKAGVLTVSDMPEFLQRGGMIQFVLDSNRVRFEINLTAAENASLTLSSELLKVAKAVRKSS